jgi:hypothetical protein
MEKANEPLVDEVPESVPPKENVKPGGSDPLTTVHV